MWIYLNQTCENGQGRARPSAEAVLPALPRQPWTFYSSLPFGRGEEGAGTSFGESG